MNKSQLSMSMEEDEEEEINTSLKIRKKKTNVKKCKDRKIFDSSDYFKEKNNERRISDDMIDLTADSNFMHDFGILGTYGTKKYFKKAQEVEEAKSFLLNIIILNKALKLTKEGLISELQFISKMNSDIGLDYQIISACANKKKFTIIYSSANDDIYGDDGLFMDQCEDSLLNLMQNTQEDIVNFSKIIRFVFIKEGDSNPEETAFVTQEIETVKKNGFSVDSECRDDLRGYVNILLDSSKTQKVK